MSRIQLAFLSILSIIAMCLAVRRKSWIVFARLPAISPPLALLVAIYIFYDLYWKRRFLPPGPTPWLCFGNIFCFLFYKSIDEMFLIWKQKYGELITFWIGTIPLVMVMGVKPMREYFVRNAEVFSNRWRNYATDSFMGGAFGVIQIDGEMWKEQRRFALRVLRDFGVGRPSIEERILTEVNFFMDHLKTKCFDHEVDICEMHAVCVGNIINSILFDYRFPQGSAEFRFLHSLLDFQSQLVIHPLMGLYISLPSTTRIPIINYKWQQFMALRNELWSFISRQVQKHKEFLNAKEELLEITDFTYAYLAEMKSRKMRNEPNGYFSEWQLTMLLLDLFFAGMETTVTTLKWGFLFSIIYPDVQIKVQHELDQVGTKITLADKPKCPFTVATICEIQRVANILPINLLRTVAKDICMGKYFYPAGTLCIPQISVAMNDPANFAEPNKFNPERFLEDDGFTLKKNDAFLPFSIGKRQCMGESLAKAELFLIYANLMRHFHFRTVPNKPYPSTERLIGLTTSPPHYKCSVERRKT